MSFLERGQSPYVSTEILRARDCTILASKHYPDRAHLDETIKYVKVTPPFCWPSLSRTHKIDSLENPQYFAKVNRVGPHSVSLALKDFHDFGKDPHFVMSQNSIAREIKASEIVKKTLSTQSVKDIANDNGFESIRLVEPILGVIGEAGQKILVFDFIKGFAVSSTAIISARKSGHHLPEYTPEHIRMARYRLFNISEELRELFLRCGIISTDLSEEQFMVPFDPADKNLYLIDLEMYYLQNKPSL